MRKRQAQNFRISGQRHDRKVKNGRSNRGFLKITGGSYKTARETGLFVQNEIKNQIEREKLPLIWTEKV